MPPPLTQARRPAKGRRRPVLLAARIARHWSRFTARERRWLRVIGPGWITGASDDDPSGIATYSQAGAQFGYSLAWVMLFTWPLMAAIQEISARIGRVTGEGIAGNIRTHYSHWLLRPIVALLLVANILNLGADLGAMGAAANLLIPIPRRAWVVAFAVGCAALETFARYERYATILKWSSLALFAYVAVAFAVPVPWGRVVAETFVPTWSWRTDDIVTIVAVLGTTITPYCFFWQSSEEAEEERVNPRVHTPQARPRAAPREMRRIRIDTWIGMGFSNLISWFIMIATAATLHAHGVTNIQTSSQAAEALRPIAGAFTFVVFAIGIIGIGLLAVPVLAGSAAYALGEALGWPTGLARQPGDAKAFYGTIAIGTLIGVFINFVDLDPIKALFWSAVINGVIAVPLMVVIMVMGMQRRVMGKFTLPAPLAAMGWLSTIVMAAAVGIMLAAI